MTVQGRSNLTCHFPCHGLRERIVNLPWYVVVGCGNAMVLETSIETVKRWRRGLTPGVQRLFDVASKD